MTTYYRQGESIRGEKILYWFGKVSPPRQIRRSKQFEIALGLHGGARVEKRVEKSRTGERRSVDEICCVSAEGVADKINTNPKKVHVGSHRVFEGYLKGDASCTIKVPMENIPDAHRR